MARGGLDADASGTWSGKPGETIGISTLFEGRILRVTFVSTNPPWGFDETGAVTVWYEIVPAEGPPTRESALETEVIAHPLTWWLSGRDDLGTEYDDRGGVFGIASSGITVDGNRDIYPAPPPGASWLEIDFALDSRETPAYTLKISLPLPVAR